MAETKVNMKLLINSETNKVLFAEAGKDCVDFLFYIMSLPIATVITLLRGHGMVGSLANLYESMETLNDTYIQTGQSMSGLLKQIGTPPAIGVSSATQLLLEDAPNEALFYRCPIPRCNSGNYSDNPSAKCPSCESTMTLQMTFVAPPGKEIGSGEGGFVKGVVTYMVMDDLVVKPMSTISSLTLLNKFSVKEVGVLQEKVVVIGMKEAVKLLKASLHSKKVLTEVFLN